MTITLMTIKTILIMIYMVNLRIKRFDQVHTRHDFLRYQRIKKMFKDQWHCYLIRLKIRNLGRKTGPEQSTTGINSGGTGDSGSFANDKPSNDELVTPNFTRTRNRIFPTGQSNDQQASTFYDTREKFFPPQKQKHADDSLHEELEVQPDDDLHGQDETKPKTLPGEPSLPAKFVNSNGTTLQYTSTGQYLEKWGKSKLHTTEELQFHYTHTNQCLPKRENSQPQTPGSIKMYSEKEYSTETLNSIPGTVDNNDQQNGQEDLSGNEGTETYEDVEKKPSHERKRILTVLIIFLCIAGMVAWISLRNTSGNSDNIQPTSRALVGNCSGYNAVGNIGKEICLAPKPSCFAFVRTGTLRNITIKQISSTYNNFETTILLNIVIPESRFNTEFNGWIVDYNISRLEQPLRIGKPNLTCGDIGEYNVTLHYEDIQDEFCQFGINNAYPQLNISFTETDKYVIVTCKLSGSCLDAFLALYINDDNNTIPIRTNKQTGCGGDATTMTRHVALQKSMIYSNASITCKPLTDNDELTENLTTTTTVCQGRECYKTCTEEQKGFYYQDPVFCDKYYQCEYPALHLRPCPELQFWNPKMCTCDHRRSDALQQCNTTTNRYDPQIRRENIQSCGGPS